MNQSRKTPKIATSSSLKHVSERGFDRLLAGEIEGTVELRDHLATCPYCHQRYEELKVEQRAWLSGARMDMLLTAVASAAAPTIGSNIGSQEPVTQDAAAEHLSALGFDRLLAGESKETDGLRAHLAICGSCRERYATLEAEQREWRAAAERIDALETAVQVEQAESLRPSHLSTFDIDRLLAGESRGTKRPRAHLAICAFCRQRYAKLEAEQREWQPTAERIDALEAAVQEVLAWAKPPRWSRDELLARLNGHEREVVALLQRGLSPRQVADALGVRQPTVHTHQVRIMRKLNVSSLEELIKKINGPVPEEKQLVYGLENDTFSRAEVEVLVGLSSGMSVEEIARARGTARITMENQIRSIIRKINLSSGYEVVSTLEELIQELDPGLVQGEDQLVNRRENDTFSSAEVEVLMDLSRGMSVEEIARARETQRSTVENQINSILHKINLSSGYEEEKNSA